MRPIADTLHPVEAEILPLIHPTGVRVATELSLSNGKGIITTYPFTPKQILIVDDELAVREMVAEFVAQAGFRADTARDGEEGWSALCLTSYDLVITDHEMPRLTGLNLIKRIRAASVEPPCILISGNLPLPEPTLNEIVHPGVVLPKPFSRVALIKSVYGLLAGGDLQEI
jgi:DNA-binding response OmpR family regulator